MGLLKSLAERNSALFRERADRTLDPLERLAVWWKHRGWSPTVFMIFWWVLICAPFNLLLYLLAGGRYHVPLNYRWLMVWMLAAGTVQAIGFWYKTILPDYRPGKQAENGMHNKGRS